MRDFYNTDGFLANPVFRKRENVREIRERVLLSHVTPSSRTFQFIAGRRGRESTNKNANRTFD